MVFYIAEETLSLLLFGTPAKRLGENSKAVQYIRTVGPLWMIDDEVAKRCVSCAL